MNTQTITPVRSGPLLLLETSAPHCSVAVADLGTGQVLAEADETTPMRHTARLLPLIREAFAKTDFGLTDAVAVGVSAGPGSYSGLRAGLSSAKGICLALGIPLVMVSSTEATAAAMRAARPEWTGDFLPLLEARRAEVYWGRYTHGLEQLQRAACVEATASWIAAQLAQGSVLAGGSGAEKVGRLDGRLELEKESGNPHARHLFTPCRIRLLRGNAAPLGAAEPDYVRLPFITREKSRL